MLTRSDGGDYVLAPGDPKLQKETLSLNLAMNGRESVEKLSNKREQDEDTYFPDNNGNITSRGSRKAKACFCLTGAILAALVVTTSLVLLLGQTLSTADQQSVYGKSVCIPFHHFSTLNFYYVLQLRNQQYSFSNVYYPTARVLLIDHKSV
jgi:hypothetical protein